MGSISNCGKDENGGFSGGKKGDQTGKEYRLIKWYSGPWTHVFRHENKAIRETISRLAADAAINDKIGYAQDTRESFWQEVKKVNYEPKNIKTACNADCSSSTCTVIKCAGHLHNNSRLENMQLLSSSALIGGLDKYGFKKYRDSKYTSSSAKLEPGDILVKDGHAAIWTSANVGDSSSSSSSSSSPETSGSLTSLGIGDYSYTSYTVKKGDTIYSIAKKYNCTPAMIMFVNNLSSTTLTVGKKLKIPKAAGKNKNASKGTSPITKKHTTGIDISRPLLKVSFFTEQELLSLVATTGVNKATDVDNDILNVTTTRDMSQDCPTFAISLVWRRDWYNILNSNDLVIISMQRPPEKKQNVFFGLIDDIRKETDFSSGTPQRVIKVTGRGFNKAFIQHSVGLISELATNSSVGFFEGLLDIATQDSYDVIATIINAYVGKSIKYNFSNKKSFKSYFRFKGNRHKGESMLVPKAYTSYNGSLWNFIKEVSNAPFDETYWEIKDNLPTLTHRRTPFNKGDWTKLKRTTIKDTDLVSDNTGRSDLETYTVYTVNPMQSSLKNCYYPLWYPPFASKYGIKNLSVSTPYQTWGSGSTDTDSSAGNYSANVTIDKNIMFSGHGSNTMEYIVLHTSCAPGSSCENICKFVKSKGCGVHGCIDDKRVLQTGNYKDLLYHCGGGNKYSFGFEQTESKYIKWNSNATVPSWDSSHNKDVKEYHDKVYANAVALFAYLGKKYNIDPSHMISHKEVSKKWGGTDHADPEELWDHFKTRFNDNKWTMDSFRANVRKAMDSMSSSSGGFKKTQATSYGHTAGDDNGLTGWDGLHYNKVKGCGVAIPTYCIKGASNYNKTYIQQDCPEFEKGYGTIVKIKNPRNGKEVNAIVNDCGNFGPHNTYNHTTLLDLQPNTQKALGFKGGTHEVQYKVIGHWDKDKTKGNGPYNV